MTRHRHQNRAPKEPHCDSIFTLGIPATGMERLWSLAGATSGNRWQIGRPRKRPNQAKTVDGKEGVDGSSPSEGSAKGPDIGPFTFGSSCRSSNVGPVWSPLWSLQVQNAVDGAKSGAPSTPGQAVARSSRSLVLGPRFEPARARRRQCASSRGGRALEVLDDPSAPGSLSRSPVTPSLNSRIPRPSDRPILGNRFARQMNRSNTTTNTISWMPMKAGISIALGSRDRPPRRSRSPSCGKRSRQR